MNKQAHQSADLQPHLFIKKRALIASSHTRRTKAPCVLALWLASEQRGAQPRLWLAAPRLTSLQERTYWAGCWGLVHSCATSIIIINIINAALESLPPVVNVSVSTRPERVQRLVLRGNPLFERHIYRRHCGLQTCCMLHEDAGAICTEGFMR